MRSHFLTNIFLLIIAVTLGTFLFIDNIDQNGIKKLSNISVDNINKITIHHKQRDIILNRIDRQWRMEKPVDITANHFRIKTLLSLLSTNSHAQYDISNLNPDKYGLEKIDTFIIFNNLKIDFGITNPINNLRYVKINNELHLIDDHYFPLLSSQVGTLIARELLPSDTRINKLVLPESTITLGENKLWQSTANISSDAIVATIQQWTHKQAFAVHDYVERKSLGKIQVYAENTETPIIFYITDIEPWLIIARPDINLEYHFNLDDYNDLLKPGSVNNTSEDASSETHHVSPDEFMNAVQSH